MLERYRESEIEIHYLTDNNAYKDRGRLVDFADGWIELFKPTAGERGETFVIPISAIRIMKILNPAPARAEDTHLLRPAGSGAFVGDVERRRLGDDRSEQELGSE